LHGGETKIYQCDTLADDGCLNPTVGTLTISKNAALQAQVAKLLNDMVDKIYADQALSQQEIGLLNATRMPIYKMLNVQAAFAGDKSVLDIDDYAGVIAADILFQYLDESLAVVSASSSSLPYPNSIMTLFLQGVSQARNSVRHAEQNAYQQVTMAAQLIQQTQALEQMLAGSLSAQLNNTLSWANNMKQ
jgi:conjugative transfer pilus assembly protein TraH